MTSRAVSYMKFKKIFSIFLVILSVATLASCGGEGDNVSTGIPSSPTWGDTNTPASPTDSDINSPTPPTGEDTNTPAPPNGGDSASNLNGSTEEILGKLVDETTSIIEAAGEFMYMSSTTEVTADLAQNAIGLSEADFNSLVISASSSMAGIGSQAHQIILIQANDDNSAAEVKKLIAGRVNGKSGYDSQKWICVWPQQSVAIESGSYVLLVASRNDIVDAALEVFRGMAGSCGNADVFFEHAGE